MKAARTKDRIEIKVKGGRQECPPHTVRSNTTVFLGGGRITGALLAGLRLAGYDRPIVVHDRHPVKLRQLRRDYGVNVEPVLLRAVEQANLLIIAVRPDAVRELLEKIGPIHPTIAVSLAAGIPLANLRGWMGKPVRWARAMPSPVARSGRGLTALTFGRDFPAAARLEVRAFFAQVGTVLEIPESKFDAFSVTYSSSQGYHALAGLAEAAEMLGLDRKTALTAAAHALADGILAWREGSISLDDLLHEAATPGGIAAATLASMDKSGYKRAVQQGLRAGMDRARRYAKG
jgi:pyrroline-5-carboxylate reductase